MQMEKYACARMLLQSRRKHDRKGITIWAPKPGKGISRSKSCISHEDAVAARVSCNH